MHDLTLFEITGDCSIPGNVPVVALPDSGNALNGSDMR